jgi:hypothetical protein
VVSIHVVPLTELGLMLVVARMAVISRCSCPIETGRKGMAETLAEAARTRLMMLEVNILSLMESLLNEENQCMNRHQVFQ